MFGIDDMAAASIIGTGVGAVGSALSSIQGNKNMKRYLRAQAEENEKAYQRNLEMWNLQNQYNDPSKQMERLRKAGLNPNLAYGSVQPAAVAPEAPINDMSPLLGQQSVGAAVAGSAQDAALRVAQIRNINADSEAKEAEAKKTGAESDYQLTYNKFAEDILTGQIKEQNSRIELNASQTDLNDMKSKESYSTIQKIFNETNRIKVEVDKIGVEIESVKEDVALKRIEKSFRSDMLKAQMSHLFAQAKLANMTSAKTQEEFNQLAASAIYNLATKKEQTNNAFLQGLVLENTASELKVKIDTEKFDLQKKHSYEILDDINKVTGTISNVIGTVTDAFTFGYRNANVWK